MPSTPVVCSQVLDSTADAVARNLVAIDGVRAQLDAETAASMGSFCEVLLLLVLAVLLFVVAYSVIRFLPKPT